MMSMWEYNVARSIRIRTQRVWVRGFRILAGDVQPYHPSLTPHTIVPDRWYEVDIRVSPHDDDE